MPNLSTNFVSVLPPEISSRIFTFLTQDYRIECAKVCRLWREAIFHWDPHIWRSYTFHFEFLDRELPLITEFAAFIEELHTFHYMFDEQEERMIIVDKDDLATLTSIALPKLRALYYTAWGLQTEVLEQLLGHVGTQLDRLHICIEYEIDTKWPPCIDTILQQCPKVRHLQFNADFSTDIMSDGFEQKTYLLQSLELTLEQFSTARLLPLLRQCPQLRRLLLSSTGACHVDLQSVLDTCHTLQSFETEISPLGDCKYGALWWKTASKTWSLANTAPTLSALSECIITNLCDAHQFHSLNNIVNIHYKTLRRIEVAFSKCQYVHSTSSQHDMIHNTPPNLEKLDYNFGLYEYTLEDLEWVIRPHLDQCSRLTWVFIKSDIKEGPYLPRWAFEALGHLMDLHHLCIQIPNDPKDMVYFLDTIKQRKTVLTSLSYQGRWDSNMDVIRGIAKITSLQCLALSVPSTRQHMPRKEMLQMLQCLQDAPQLHTLAFTHVNGFGTHRVWKAIRDMPHLKHLYVFMETEPSQQGMRHLVDRQPRLETLVAFHYSDNYHGDRGHELEQALEYARTKLKCVYGRQTCREDCCQTATTIPYRAWYGLS
ncbi:hypothetical protein K492DRAFT_198664 [Lichtheimia hyalospora FSU 10163]|nr:hypothetical protein K492DRAFT_198664 [Lichtheimia hyalospora FSU 10163]